MYAGVAQEPGRPRLLHCGRRRGRRDRSGPGLRGSSTPRERTGAKQWYRRAKATKRGGMEGEGSESTDNTEEIGEPAPGDPVEESGGPGYGAF